MKQLQFTFTNDDALRAELRTLRQWAQSRLYSTILIQIYTEVLDEARVGHVCEEIGTMLPEALIVGCSSNGNIVKGDFSGDTIALICTMFEYPTTKVEVLQYSLLPEQQAEVCAALCREVADRGWVKGVELLVTIRGMSMTGLCEGLSKLPAGIQVFGGGAFSADLDSHDAFVFTKDGGFAHKGVVFVLYGGDEFHLDTSFVTGWKPLGSYLDVTATDGYILKELNHRPAYEIYYKYLHIRNDEHFFYNTLEFPFLYRYNGIDIMRAPISSNPDGSLTMTSDMSEHDKARIAYGDPWTILESAWQKGNAMLPFAPECVSVFSCAARRTFWGNDEVGKETEPYQIVAPTSGFYTSGEFLRTGEYVNQHNVTQVIAIMREGEPRPHPEKHIAMAERTFEGKVSMINRMATFIKATTEELEEANRKLSEIAVTDALTGLGNKTAYMERMRQLDNAIAAGVGDFCVAVFDINGLKQINDTYGHECGDIAITDAAGALKAAFGRENLYRIGGDEYIAILEGATDADMTARFDALSAALDEFNRTPNPYKTPLAISRGWTAFDPERDAAYRDVFRRADDAMYQDKAAYYRTHDRRRG